MVFASQADAADSICSRSRRMPPRVKQFIGSSRIVAKSKCSGAAWGAVISGLPLIYTAVVDDAGQPSARTLPNRRRHVEFRLRPLNARTDGTGGLR